MLQIVDDFDFELLTPEAAETQRPDAEITVFAKSDGRLTKTISLGKDGKPDANAHDCRMSAGTARRAAAPDAESLAAILNGLRDNEAIGLGSIREDMPDQVMIVNKARADGVNTLSRSHENISYRAGVPAWALLDFDTKHMPAAVAAEIDRLGGFARAIYHVCPEIQTASRVLTSSSSSGLRNADTGEVFLSSKGKHFYCLLQDGSDVKRFIKDLFDRLWLHGLGWIALSSKGDMLERAPVDMAVRFGERLVFEAAPNLVHPITRDASAIQVRTGVALDSLAACKPLDDFEREKLRELKAAAKLAINPEADLLRRRSDGELVAKLEAQGIGKEKAERFVAMRRQGSLLPHVELSTDNDGVITVGAVLADPERWVGATMADPMEGPDYGRCKAKIFMDDEGCLKIHSFAHGSAIYRLLHSDISAIDAIRRVKSDHVEAAVQIYKNSELTEDERDVFAREVQKLSQVPLRAIKARLENIDRKTLQEYLRGRIAEARNGRKRLDALNKDEELTPTIRLLDGILSEAGGKVPPMRNNYGQLVTVRSRPTIDAHELTSSGSNGEGIDANAAPSELKIDVLQDGEVELLVERHVVFVRVTNSGQDFYLTQMPSSHNQALASFQDSKIAKIKMVISSPVVTLDGTVVDGDGFDPDSGLFFAIDPIQREAVAGPVPTTEQAVESVDFLINKWLQDVSSGPVGKVLLVAMAMTLLERHLFKERPAFFVSASVRGSGKTTAINLVAAAALGTRASAAAWSYDANERRKALLGYLLDGAAMICWDNIPRGLQISDASIEAAITSSVWEDRELGRSEVRKALCRTVFAFTGNAIGPKGDMASRSLVVKLDVERPDPENRPFAFADPIGWTLDNRAMLLRALYDVLRWGAANRPKDAELGGRFKTWQALVGWPLEQLTARLPQPIEYRTANAFGANEAEDEEANAVTELVTLLKAEFGTRRFVAKDLAEKCPKPGYISGQGSANDEAYEKGKVMLEAINALATRPFPIGAVSLIGLTKTLAVQAVGRVVNVDGEMLKLRSQVNSSKSFGFAVRPAGEGDEIAI